MNNVFFTFFKPYFSFIDNGYLYRKPFSWFYSLLAVLNLILPLGILFIGIDNGVLGSGAKFVMLFLTLWAIIAFASWFGFQLWWDRRLKVTSTSVDGDDFVATPVFAHFIQTVGEWIGTWIAIVGSCTALLTTIFLDDQEFFFLNSMGLDFLRTGIVFVVLMPIYGFLIIVSSRFLAEQFKSLSVIANNTRK